MSLKKGNEIPTIDVTLVTITTVVSGSETATELALNTSNKLGVQAVIETTEAIKNIVKGRLIAQKPQQNTVTGNTLTLTDNVFNPELVKILQGGTITYDETDSTQFVSYAPPVVGSDSMGEIFTLNAYSAIYDTAGLVTGYEKTTYPNCQGVPVAFNSEDGVFRAPEYTINSAPATGESPYTITIVDSLPTIS